MLEIPFAVLSHRAPSGTNVIERSWESYDANTRRDVKRKVTVIGDGKCGLPTVRDEEIYQGLLHTAKEANDLRERRVLFSRGALLETVGWKKSTANYKRLTLAMDKLAGTRLICENLWRDNDKRQTRIRENVSILDSYEFRDGRIAGRCFEESSSEFIWGAKLFESFQSGYVKRLNLAVVLSLSPLGGRLARLLDKIAHPERGKRQFDFDVRELLCERMGASRETDLSHLIRRLLLPACKELEEIRFIRPETCDRRVTRSSRGRATVRFEVIADLSGKKRMRTSIEPGVESASRPERRIFKASRGV